MRLSDAETGGVFADDVRSILVRFSMCMSRHVVGLDVISLPLLLSSARV